MRLAVYVPDSRPYPYVLTPECMQPSLTCEHEYGHLRLKGVVMLDERLLPAIAHSISPRTDFEYVIYNGVGVRTIDTLMESTDDPRGFGMTMASRVVWTTLHACHAATDGAPTSCPAPPAPPSNNCWP